MRFASSAKGKLIEIPLLVIVAFGISFIVKTFLVQAFYILSGSMENTLQVGDRVIGMPGDHVVCCTTKGNLTVNGHELGESSYIYDR